MFTYEIPTRQDKGETDCKIFVVVGGNENDPEQAVYRDKASFEAAMSTTCCGGAALALALAMTTAHLGGASARQL